MLPSPDATGSHATRLAAKHLVQALGAIASLADEPSDADKVMTIGWEHNAGYGPDSLLHSIGQ